MAGPRLTKVGSIMLRLRPPWKAEVWTNPEGYMELFFYETEMPTALYRFDPDEAKRLHALLGEVVQRDQSRGG